MLLTLFVKSDASNRNKCAYYVRLTYPKDTTKRIQTYYLAHRLSFARKELQRLLDNYEGAELSEETKTLYAMDIIDPGYLERTLKEQFDVLPKS